MNRYIVKQGSIYNPGWVVYEQVSERRFRKHGTFKTKKAAQELCNYLNWHIAEVSA